MKLIATECFSVFAELEKNLKLWKNLISKCKRALNLYDGKYLGSHFITHHRVALYYFSFFFLFVDGMKDKRQLEAPIE
jgi:hypothetical protein